MNRIAFILPYFGKFKNYFQLFLYSCRENADLCDWYLFTDDHTEYDYPTNVIVKYMSWGEMKQFIVKRMPCDVVLERPYKLCDYKVAYGYLFAEYLKGYEFWGECDCDLIWGKISKFLSQDILDNYDKIFNLAHCTIYRNNAEMNSLFMQKLNGRERYKEVYASEENFSFDEEYNNSINNIALEHGIRLYENSFAANTYTKSSNFLLTTLSEDRHHYFTEEKSDSFFVWNEGHLYRYIKRNGELSREEYMYIHFQSRPMNVSTEVDSRIIKIIPNSFDKLEVDEITYESFNKIIKKHPNLHYFKLRSKNLYLKLRKFFKRYKRF